MLSVRAHMSDGARRTIAIVMPDCSSGSQVYAETCRKLRERFRVTETVVEYDIVNRWPTKLPAYT